MQKLLFVCNDFIGNVMAGPGIRYWELAHALERKGFKIAVLARQLERNFSKSGITYLGRSSLKNLITWIRWSDCIIQPGSPLSIIFPILFRKKMYFDQYDPVIFEFLERIPPTLSGKLHKSFMLFLWKVRQRMILRFGCRFLVANEKQKDFLIGQLAVLGYRDKLSLVTVLPFGLPDAKPIRKRPVLRGSKIKADDFLLVWGGGIWDWFDPFTLLHALSKIRSQREDIKVYFPGINPPSPDSRKLAVVDEFLSEARRLGLLDNTVFVNREWTPYEERGNYLVEADAGVSLHRDSLETRFAFRTRMLDYLWAGLPMIASKGDSWADLIERRGMGITVRPGDVDAVADAILRMADDKQLRTTCCERARAVATEYRWDELANRLSLQ
jgi:glycosyltransferase involved in cell wall biosynthesis